MGIGFETQDRTASESVVATPRSGGTWEREDMMRATCHFLFEDEGALSSLILGTRINYCIFMCLCVQVCVNFGDKNLLRGEEFKTREKLNFSKKW